MRLHIAITIYIYYTLADLEQHGDIRPLFFQYWVLYIKLNHLCYHHLYNWSTCVTQISIMYEFVPRSIIGSKQKTNKNKQKLWKKMASNICEQCRCVSGFILCFWSVRCNPVHHLSLNWWKKAQVNRWIHRICSYKLGISIFDA